MGFVLTRLLCRPLLGDYTFNTILGPGNKKVMLELRSYKGLNHSFDIMFPCKELLQFLQCCTVTYRESISGPTLKPLVSGPFCLQG